MKTRKIISLCCVIALLLCMSANVAGADLTPNKEVDSTSGTTEIKSTGTEHKITVGSKLFIPTIEVVVGEPNGIIVNPYKMEYSSDKFDSLVSAPTTITNNSSISMTVSAKPVAVELSTSKVDFAASSGIENDKTLTRPTVYIAMDMASFESLSDAKDFDSPASDVTTVVISKTNDRAASVTLTSKTADDATAFGAYHFVGESAGPNWTENDVVKLEVVFQIDPVIRTASVTP